MAVAGYFRHVRDVHTTAASKGTGMLTSVTPHTVDLSFLTDRERAIILKVIKADMELKRTTLGYLKKVIEAGKQFQLTQESTGESREKCGCCGQGFYTFSDQRGAEPCVLCQHTVCKKCKKIRGGDVMCIICIKERLYMLQSLDYLPVFRCDTSSSDRKDDTDGTTLEPLYGSVLLKKSLETTRRQVMFAMKSGSLKESMSLDLSEENLAEKEKPAVAVQPTYSTSIYDRNSGFKLIKETATEEELIDLCSLYSEPCDPTEDYKITGRIMFGVWYKMGENILFVRISKLEKLVAIKGGTSDPYVKTYLLPGKNKLMKRRTGIQRATTKPEINELLKYGNISQEEVKKKILWVSVWNWDRFGRNQFLGEVRLPLSSLDLTDSTDKWYDLQGKGEDEVDYFESRGRILISLRYDPPTATVANVESSLMSIEDIVTPGRLHIMINRAEDLRPNDVTAQINPFARCYLLPNRLVDSKKKSRVLKDTLNPVWESMVMYHHISLEELESSRVLEVTVWDEDRRGVNQFIGGIRLGPDPLTSMNVEWMDSNGDEITHWEEMLAHPGEWVEQWHHLRPSMDSLHNIEEKRKLRSKSPQPDSIVALALSPEPSDSSASSRESSPGILPVITGSLLESKTFGSKQPQKGDYEISGEILVTVEYKDGEIVVYVDRAVGIAAASTDGTSDSYVKIYLLPDRTKQSKRKSELQKKTIDPLYNAALKYKVPFDQLGSRAIWLTVWNQGRFGKKLFLGEVCIPLTSINLKQPSEKWYKLNDISETEIPGVVLPSAAVNIEEDLLARTPAPHRSRTTAVTTGSIKGFGHSKSASPAHAPKIPTLVTIEEDLSTQTPAPAAPRTTAVTMIEGFSLSKSGSPSHVPEVSTSVAIEEDLLSHSPPPHISRTTAVSSESITGFSDSKSASPLHTPEVSVPDTVEGDFTPKPAPHRSRATVLTKVSRKSFDHSKSASPSHASEVIAPDTVEEDFIPGRAPHRSRATVVADSLKGSRSKSASPSHTPVIPKLLLNSEEADKISGSEPGLDVFSSFTSYY